MMHPDDSDALQLQPEPDKLYRYHRQQLSAMLDGELPPDQARFMLRRLEHDTGLAECWERWQVCGDVLRGRQAALLPADFAASVARAIAGDASAQDAVVRSAGQAARRGGLLRWGGSAALAASVAVVALLVGRQAQAPLEVETPAPARVAAADPVPEPVPAPAAPAEAPAAAPLEGVTLAMAGASALAVAETPRRDERRSRGQSQRAAATRERRRQEAAAPERVLAAANAPALPAAHPASGAFVAEAAPEPAARPWPQAGFGGASPFAAGYAPAAGLEAPSFHPFEPRLDARPAMPLPALVWPQAATAVGTHALEPAPPADAD
ncbi:sigma-E factor negative regulatory protein [Luteimonas sp. Y-2-2-4F]|nr:sigma-E factor negative regulatory protein [Luteimonas sp. Y-2-2-4F]MCD9031082.1 sigma-E factor negative regulatory protein [Luteimonas sp. Y-2-2-4F]